MQLGPHPGNTFLYTDQAQWNLYFIETCTSHIFYFKNLLPKISANFFGKRSLKYIKGNQSRDNNVLKALKPHVYRLWRNDTDKYNFVLCKFPGKVKLQIKRVLNLCT